MPWYACHMSTTHHLAKILRIFRNDQRGLLPLNLGMAVFSILCVVTHTPLI